MVPCCSTAAGTALVMLCQLRGHVLFHVFCLDYMMLWNWLVVPTPFCGTFFSLHLPFPIYADYSLPVNWHYRVNSSYRKQKSEQHKEEGKNPQQQPKPIKHQSTSKSSAMNQKGNPWRTEDKSNQTSTERPCSPPDPLAVGHSPSWRCSLPWQGRYCLSASAALTVRGCPQQGKARLGPTGWGGEAAAVGGLPWLHPQTQVTLSGQEGT